MKKVFMIFLCVMLATLCGCMSNNQKVEISETSRKETVGNVSFDIPDNWTRKDANGTTYFYTPTGDSLCYGANTLSVPCYGFIISRIFEIVNNYFSYFRDL